MKKKLLLLLIYVLSASFSLAEESHTDDIFFTDDAPFCVQKKEAEMLNSESEYNEYGFKIKECINILPNDSECTNLTVPMYLLKAKSTKYFEKGILDKVHTGFYYKGALTGNIERGSDTDIFYTNKNVENHIRGYFKDGKTSFNITARYYKQRDDLKFFQFLIGNLYISHQLNPHNRIIIGNSRTHSGEEGARAEWMLPFVSYSQISRNTGNVRKFGARIMGEYDLVEYDLGGFSSDTYFRSFFPGAEFTGWVNFKPLGKTQGQYGDLKIGGGISSGHDNFSYNVAGAYARYKYKKFKADFEFANADGYNGRLGLSKNHARGMYTTVYYQITPKVELLARYDTFQPNLGVSNQSIKEYVMGLNYYVKGQGLRFMINYIFRQSDFDKDSHRIIIGTQLML